MKGNNLTQGENVMRQAEGLDVRAPIVPEFFVNGISSIDIAGRMMCFTLYSKRRGLFVSNRKIIYTPAVRLFVTAAEARRINLQASVAISEFESDAEEEMMMVH